MTLVTRKQKGLDSFLNDFMGGELFMSPENNFRGTKITPAANIAEDADAYFIDLAAPGLKKSDFNIEFNNGLLSISAKSEVKEIEGRKQTLNEFDYTNFKKSFTVSKQKVNEDSIEANYENGVLSIILPKREEAKVKPKRTIEIK